VRDVLPAIDRWRAAGQGVAVATVIKVWGSAPRPIGSRMVISSAGQMDGSVSGGCVEGAVLEAAQAVLATRQPRLLKFGVSDDRAWAVGLSCGGEIEVFVEPVDDPPLRAPLAVPGDAVSAGTEKPAPGTGACDRLVRGAMEADRPVVVATVVEGATVGARLAFEPGGASAGSLGSVALDAVARERARELLTGFRCEKITVPSDPASADLFIECLGPRQTVLIVGAVHVAIPLVRLAGLLGFRTVVVDPRGAFATADRFGHADQLLAEWPDEAFAQVGLTAGTFLVVLSHDLKIDVPAIALALRSPAPYIGALGSAKTQRKRAAALEDEGFTAADLARIHSPIGLDLGGRRAEEVALAIMAEVVAVSHGVGARKAAQQR
jgi:xanthine dehydrogenase accessory factor